MNNITIFILKALRKGYQKMMHPTHVPYDRGITDPDEASKVIYDLLASGKPCMIARYGSTELLALTNYLGVVDKHHSVCKYIQGKQFAWWWEDNVKDQMTRWSGFFPSTEENLMKFGELMVEDSQQVDVLGSWLPDEQVMIESFRLKFEKVTLLTLEPYWAKHPWSRILEGKKVLVIHPFSSLIEKQYAEKRKFLFENKDVLPLFELKTIQAVQSLGGTCAYNSWFDALDAMKAQMDAIDYDIALIGCGAYGFPLAAHAKRMGKQAVHLGGALQLLFGIRGKRWDNPEFGSKSKCAKRGYRQLFNKEWIYPTDAYKPKSAEKVEGGCYW